MHLFKLLLLGLLCWVFVSIIRKKTNIQGETQQHTNGQAEQVVACQHCGLHIPESEAIKQQQQSFCSQQHLDAYETHQH